MKDLLHILLLAMIVCCWSCSGGEEEPIPTPTPKPESNKIEITTSAPVVEQKGGTATVSFTTNAVWTASVSTTTSWVSVSPSSGAAGTHTLTVTTAENDTYDERNATLTIKAGNASQNLTITQKQKDALTVTSNKVEIGSEGGTFSIEAKANVSVSYEIEEAAKKWISASESRGLTTKTLNFTAKANDKIERRQGNIILKGGDGLTETITIYQEGKEVSLVLTTEKDMTIGAEGGTLKIELESDAEIKMEELETDWLHLSSSRTMSAYTYYLEVDANETYDERNAAITFTSGDKKQIVTITQKQKDALTITSNKVEIGSEGGTFSIEAKANVSVSYEIEEAAKKWISASESRGLTTKTLNFTAKANDKIERRQGNIILKGGDGLTETITIYQEGEKPTLVITSEDIVVGSKGETIKIELKSNVDYEIVLPETDWIIKEESRAISAYTHYLTIATNETYDQRSAIVYFQNAAESLKDSICITQLQKDAIIVAKNEYTIASEGGNLEFSVNTNVDFEVSVSVDWIKQNTESRSLVEKLLSFVIAENEDTEPREGEIVITYQDLKQTIKITQKGGIDYEAIERAALIEFYKATNGDNWVNNDNWCSDKPLNQWEGIETNEKGRVTRLYKTYDINIIGNIPECIGDLTALKYLSLEGNKLNGNIPESIGKLTSLEKLSLMSNELNGNIPESIGNLTSLKQLFLSSNQLSGSIPESIGNLKELIQLDLSFNHLDSNIPESIGYLTNLKRLFLLSNQLNGNIPESIGNLTNLENLAIYSNQLSGNIPETIGNLSKLTSFHSHYNQLTGNIPKSIGNLKELTSLLLEKNQLNGSIPESMGNLTNLEELTLSDNQLSGKIPESLTKLNVWKNGWPAILKNNRLSLEGTVLPTPQFTVVDIDGNTIFSGEEYTNNLLTVLYQWGTWCGNSKSFNVTLTQLYKKYKSAGFEIIGGCHGPDPSTDIAYINEQKIPWRNYVLTPEEPGIPILKMTRYTPELIAIDNKGKVVFQSFTQSYFDFQAWLEEYFPSYSNKDIYTSIDYTHDGDVITLQTATEGKGINLVLLGEAFVDLDMGSGGLYEQKMMEAMEHLFSIEPYMSMRNRFNVYTVKVVSPNAEFNVDSAEHRLNMDDAVCFEYAQKIPNANINPPMVTVVYNTWYSIMRSRCRMYTDGSFVSYIMGPDVDGGILLHETGGHGFANLLDEYVEDENITLTLPEEGKKYLDNRWNFGWGANVDWRNDASTVKWSHFLNDSRYANEGLGLYEGAYLYGHGAYRPTENSMMRYNDSPFNAPSREQIYKRIMQLSEGDDWKYDYEEFVKFDENSRNAASRSAVKLKTEAERKEYLKNHRPPTYIKGTWRDAIKKGKTQIVVPFR